MGALIFMCIMSRVSCQPCFTGVMSSVMLAHHGNASDYEQHSLPWLRSCLRCGRNHNPLCSLLVDACGAGGELSGPVAKTNQEVFMLDSHKAFNDYKKFWLPGKLHKICYSAFLLTLVVRI